MFDIAIEAGADDLQTEDTFFEVSTSIENFEPVRRKLIDAKLKITNASLQWVAKNLIELSGETAEKAMKIIDALEDSDEVQNVFTNADFQEM